MTSVAVNVSVLCMPICRSTCARRFANSCLSCYVLEEMHVWLSPGDLRGINALHVKVLLADNKGHAARTCNMSDAGICKFRDDCAQVIGSFCNHGSLGASLDWATIYQCHRDPHATAFAEYCPLKLMHYPSFA